MWPQEYLCWHIHCVFTKKTKECSVASCLLAFDGCFLYFYCHLKTHESFNDNAIKVVTAFQKSKGRIIRFIWGKRCHGIMVGEMHQLLVHTFVQHKIVDRLLIILSMAIFLQSLPNDFSSANNKRRDTTEKRKNNWWFNYGPFPDAWLNCC